MESTKPKKNRRCIARNRRGERCGLPALDGAPHCGTEGHDEPHAWGSWGDDDPEADAEAGRTSATASDVGGGAPEDHPAADPADWLPPDPGLFGGPADDLDPMGGEDRRPEATSEPRPAGSPGLLEANPGPWTPSAVRPVSQAVSAALQRLGAAPLEREEAEPLERALAACANRVLGRADPSNPWWALSLASVAIVAPRAPAIRRAVAAARGRDADDDARPGDGEGSQGAGGGWDRVPL